MAEHNARHSVVRPPSRAVRQPPAPPILQAISRASAPGPSQIREKLPHASERPQEENPRRTGRHGRGARRRGRLDPAQAGPDVLDPQGPVPRTARRSWAWARSRCCPTASASCARPRPIIWPAPTTSTSRPTRSANSACAPATRSRARSAAPKDGERYFALAALTPVNFDDPDAVRHRVNFDNLTPLYPDEKLQPRHARPDDQGQVGAGDRHRLARRARASAR